MPSARAEPNVAGMSTPESGGRPYCHYANIATNALLTPNNGLIVWSDVVEVPKGIF